MLWRDLDRAPHPGQKVGRRLSTVTVKACSRRSTLTTFMPAAGDHVIDVFIAPCCRIPSQGASPPASSGASHQASLAPRVNQTPRKRDFRSCSICEVFNNIRRFETSLKRLKCANCGHSQTVRGTGQVDPLLPFPFGSGYERMRRSGRSSRDKSICADPFLSKIIVGSARAFSCYLPPAGEAGMSDTRKLAAILVATGRRSRARLNCGKKAATIGPRRLEPNAGGA